MTEKELISIAEKAVQKLIKENKTLSVAESCTGGMVSSYITSVSGVSNIFEMGICSYSCRIKNEILGVKQETLDRYGAVSQNTAKEMAENIRKMLGSKIVQVKGVMPPRGGITHETPTGRAVGAF